MQQEQLAETAPAAMTLDETELGPEEVMGLEEGEAAEAEENCFEIDEK